MLANERCFMQGVLVEPSPKSFEHLVINRPNSIQASLLYPVCSVFNCRWSVRLRTLHDDLPS